MSDDWHTPASLLDPIGLTYDLNPCAPLDRTFYFVKAHKTFTKADDGLAPTLVRIDVSQSAIWRSLWPLALAAQIL